MKYDPDAFTLKFNNAEEVERFHLELTELFRGLVTEASRHGTAEEGKAAAREVFKEFATIMRALNALRSHLTPTPGGA